MKSILKIYNLYKICTAIFCTVLSANSFAAPQKWQLGFQEAATKLMSDITWLHNIIMFVITFIVIFVVVAMVYICVRFNSKTNPVAATFSHNVKLEIFWTIVPTIILLVIAIPSFRLLDSAEHYPKPDFTIKVIGNQWYWNYQYPDHGGFKYDSNMLSDAELKDGQKRLLDVDNPIVIPAGANVQFLITSQDVIHSFAMPSAGIKMDAVPGRTNAVSIQIDKIGTYYGQCSELCGINHAFMPIMLKVVTQEEFQYWITASQKKFE
jgi:cytochrome c oxidase subunit 2